MADPFKEEATQPAAFTLLDDSTTSVEMMRNTTRAGYAEGADYKAVALPYDGDELSMVVIVPGPGKFTRASSRRWVTPPSTVSSRISAGSRSSSTCPGSSTRTSTS